MKNTPQPFASVMKNVELIFIPSPVMGHLVSTVETAKLLVDMDGRLSITVLIIQPPTQSDVSTYIQSLDGANNERITFINLITDIPPHEAGFTYIESHKNQVKDVLMARCHSNDSVLAGIVIDMFCTSMIDVATELGLPTYGFFTSNAAFLTLMFYFQVLVDEQNMDIVEYKDSGKELLCPGFVSPIPAQVLPLFFVQKEWNPIAIDLARRLKLETKGIMVNTFLELETSWLSSLYNNQSIPPVYPVGPVMNLKGDDEADGVDNIMKWLDAQHESSVVFLCFGSMGSFSPNQVKEIAAALEQSGHPFLWSLRKTQPKGFMSPPLEYSNFDDVLPQGFLERTTGKGKVIGWAPQVKVLAHPAVGGFVSHCGWNSILESVWFGVPIAAWPMYAEQQLNAFQLVKELGLAVEIKMDYMKDPIMGIEKEIVTIEEIKKGIMELMNDKSDVRKRMKEMSGKSRKASVNGGGSSFSSLRSFIDDVVKNVKV